MHWIFYKISQIPDLELVKYQSLGDQGVSGVIQCHNGFLRQWQRNSCLLNIGVHYFVVYSPEHKPGRRISIYIGISAEEKIIETSIDALVMSSGLYNYYSFSKCSEIPNELKEPFSSMAILKKQEQKKTSDISDLFTVEGWKTNDDARLFEMIKVMEALNEKAVYTVTLFGNNILQRAYQALDKPIKLLRKRTFGNGNDGQISLTDEHRNAPRDYAAENTLKTYEEFLKDISKSPCFSANIRVLANDKNIANYILNAACGESISEGDCEIVSLDNKQIIPLRNNNSISEYNKMMPPMLSFWPTLFTLEEVSPFFRLPILYDGENIEIPKETSPQLSSEGIYVGQTSNGYKTYISNGLLKKHAFVCGVPGSGKTNTMLHIADALWNNRVEREGKTIHEPIPFLVLEPAKREYRELALFDIPELIIFSPSAKTDFPLQLNPFEFPLGLTLSEHISKLCQVFEGAFPIAPPAPFILDRAIESIYIQHGWNTRDVNVGDKEYPTTSELYEQFKKEMENTSYDNEIQGNIRSVLEMRIGSLLRREMKDIFDAPKSTFAPEEWLKRPIIMELESLGEGPANFVTLLLCTLIRETLKVSPLKDPEKEIRHVIFIEEAHNLIAPQAQVENGQDSNPKIAATAYIVKMLAEVRALREGIIIADQLPTAMAPEVIKNTNIKLVHRLTSGDDRELIGSTMSASGLQLERVATYQPGEALMSYEGLLRPFEMRVVELKDHGIKTPNDNELIEIMLKKPAFYELCKERADHQWKELKRKVKELIQKEQDALNKLAQYDFSGRTSIQIQKSIEQFELIYEGIRILKHQYIFDCDYILSSIYDEDKKKALKNIIMTLGETLYKQIKNVLMVCVENALI